MPHTYQVLIEHAKAAGHRVVDDGSATLVVVNAAAGRVVELLLPSDIWEWYFTVRDADGTEIFSGWDEMFAVDGMTPEELTAVVNAAASRLMQAVAGAELRVVPRPGVRFLGREWLKGHALEIDIRGTWTPTDEVLYPTGSVEAQLAALRQRAQKGAG